MSKIFVIGLPRTGTTSLSVAMLEAGFSVAHTAFSQATFELADVISDAPSFSDFQQLDRLFPNSKFIYLNRDLAEWLPSMQRLLRKMETHLKPKTGYFNPVLKRSFQETFAIDCEELLSDQHLIECYQTHYSRVSQYFLGRKDYIEINLSDANSLPRLFTFLGLDFTAEQQFPHLNKGKRVANWKAYKHPNKVNSLSAGVFHRQFFDYIKGYDPQVFK